MTQKSREISGKDVCILIVAIHHLSNLPGKHFE